MFDSRFIDKYKQHSNWFKRKVNVKPCGYNKIYMDKDLTEDKLYQLVDKLNEKINQRLLLYIT